MLTPFAYVRPGSLDEALQQLRTDGARVSAGGSDLLGCLRDEVFECSKVVSISGLGELKGITHLRDGSVHIGALTPIADIASNPIIAERYRVLSQAASEVASPQLRNQGTIGGNICQRPRCWYFRGEFHCLRKGGPTCYAIAGENQYHAILGGARCYIVHPSDTAPALVALEAQVTVAGPNGTRTVPMDDFYLLPDQDIHREAAIEPNEIVTEIVLPRPPAGLRSSYRKVRARRSWDFALAGVALALRVEGGRVRSGRVVLSGAAPIPWRSREAESVIAGNRLDQATCRRAAEAAMASAVPLKRNGYKIPLFKGVIEEELLAIGA
jgi:xanthine dehydrogenase YagS FAD-binding subunit